MNTKHPFKIIDELVKPKDLDFIRINDALNDNLWDGFVLKPLVRKSLLETAKNFIEFIDVKNLQLVDITLTGSMANFNWSKFSDIDLHLIVDISKQGNNPTFIKEFFDLKKNAWNNDRDVRIYGHDVEVYVQGIDDIHTSSGVYSVYKNEWINKPEKELVSIDKKQIKRKTDHIMNIIDDLQKIGNPNKILDVIDKLKSKIKTFRKSGLDSNGEYSIENLSFKVLRNSGYLQKINNIKDNIIDKSLSINELESYTPIANASDVYPETIEDNEPSRQLENERP